MSAHIDRPYCNLHCLCGKLGKFEEFTKCLRNRYSRGRSCENVKYVMRPGKVLSCNQLCLEKLQ